MAAEKTDGSEPHDAEKQNVKSKEGLEYKGKQTHVDQSMPYYSEAVTPREKFVNYSLDYSNKKAAGKAEAYERGLGYTIDNADGLIEQIHTAITSGIDYYDMNATEYGIKYKFCIPITGPNGKTKNVIAVYQIDNGKEIPRMVTNYMEGNSVLKEYDLVRTLVAKEGFPIGTIGVIVSQYGDSPAYEVELWDKTSYPIDVIMYLSSEVELVEDIAR